MRLKVVVIMAIFVLPGIVRANEKGNGGDICEDRFISVRDDIRSWIAAGGAAGLTLPGNIQLAQYESRMTTEISESRVSCTDQRVVVEGAEKTCKYYFTQNNTPHIVCNAARFMATSDSDQYVLVHHEYAGLAGFEVNDGPSSQYSISNQITEYLQDEVVKKARGESPTGTSCCK